MGKGRRVEGEVEEKYKVNKVNRRGEEEEGGRKEQFWRTTNSSMIGGLRIGWTSTHTRYQTNNV